MLKKYIYILSIFALGVFFSSCESSTEPPATTTGGIYVQSSPAGAQIWVDGTNQNKVTPDSVTGLSAADHSITLKLTGYNDTTFTVTVVANQTKSVPAVTLTSSLLTVTYGPVRLWETIGTTASQPSGLILSTGSATGISSGVPGKDSADIYYSSNGFVIRTAAPDVNNRDTKFLVGNSTNLLDNVASPIVSGSWTDRVQDTETNYFFLNDANNHYSKMIVTNRGGGTPGNPAWVEVKWIYNKTVGDTRF